MKITLSSKSIQNQNDDEKNKQSSLWIFCNDDIDWKKVLFDNVVHSSRVKSTKMFIFNKKCLNIKRNRVDQNNSSDRSDCYEDKNWSEIIIHAY